MVMQIRALKTFNSKQIGLVREGMIVTVDDRYGKQLTKSGLAAPHAPAVVPADDKSLPGPDKTKGNEGNVERDDTADSSLSNDGETKYEPAPESGEMESSSEDQPAGGRKRRLSSRQVVRRSRKSS